MQSKKTFFSIFNFFRRRKTLLKNKEAEDAKRKASSGIDSESYRDTFIENKGKDSLIEDY